MGIVLIMKYFVLKTPIYCLILVFEKTLSIVEFFTVLYLNKILYNELCRTLFVINEKHEALFSLFIVLIIISLIEVIGRLLKSGIQYVLIELLKKYNDTNEREYNEMMLYVDIFWHENKEKSNYLMMLKNYQSCFEIVYREILNIFFTIGEMVMSIYILLTFDYRCIILAIFSFFPTYIMALYYKKREYEIEKKISVNNRMVSYLNGLYHNIETLEDIKIFCANKMFENLHIENTEARNKISRKERKKVYIGKNIGAAYDTIIILIQTYIVINKIIVDKLTIGDYYYYAKLTSRFKQQLEQLSNDLAEIKINIMKAKEYLDFKDKLYSKKTSQNTCHEVDKINIIEFKNVKFKYRLSDQYVLDDLNMKIQSGEKIAVVGLNGSGKTTILKLLNMLYYPSEGNIIINETMKLSEINEEKYYKLIATCMQGTGAFKIPLINNITMSEDINEAIVMEKIINVNLQDDLGIEDIYKYSEKDFNDNGIILSKGQIQKLCIARCIYNDVSVYMFDECTANSDEISKNKIMNYILSLKNKIVIVSLHDYSYLSKFDKVLYLSKNGKPIYGRLDKILQSNDEFKSLIENDNRIS